MKWKTNTFNFMVLLFIGFGIMLSITLYPAAILAQPPVIREVMPIPPLGMKVIPVDFSALQKESQNLRLQRDQLEKEIDSSVSHIRLLKKELKNADNPVTKFFYRRQLESQFAIFREKVDQLVLVETRLSTIIHELDARIVHEPSQGRPNLIPPPPPIPGPMMHPLVIPPPGPLEWVTEPYSFPPEFDQWIPAEKTRFIQQEINRISQQKKQLELAIQQHQDDLLKLQKMLDRSRPSESKPTKK